LPLAEAKLRSMVFSILPVTLAMNNNQFKAIFYIFSAFFT